jgi:hypothetical protein
MVASKGELGSCGKKNAAPVNKIGAVSPAPPLQAQNDPGEHARQSLR